MSKKCNPHENIFAHRLREARQKVGLSQKQLGIIAGIDEFVASTRINRYEQGVHEPDIRTAAILAKVLGVPLAYLFAEDDQLAAVILEISYLIQEELINRADTSELLSFWQQLSGHDKKKLLSKLRRMVGR